MIKEKEFALMEETDLIFRTVWKRYQSYLMPEESELSLHQMMLLKYLERKGTCTPTDIAQKFGITLGAVTGFVDRLYKLGLIRRTRSEEDRRVVLIQISPQGIEPLTRFKKEREVKLVRIFQKLEALQAAELHKALEQLNSALEDLEVGKE